VFPNLSIFLNRGSFLGNRGRNNDRKDFSGISDVILTLVLIIATIIGTYWAIMFMSAKFPISSLPGIPPSYYDLYKDILQTVLAVASIVIAAIAVGLYKILSQQIETEVTKKVEARYREAISQLRRGIGFTFWKNSTHYHQIGQPAIADEYIALAIEAAQYAGAGMQENDPSTEAILCEVRNDWAWYIYEKATRTPISNAEKALALYFVEYLEKRLGKYPARAEAFQDTIVTIRSPFTPAPG
jgi:hypothetical protein